MNTEKNKAYSGLGQTDYPKAESAVQEQPKIAYLIERQASLIHEIAELKQMIGYSIHRLHDTNVPEKTSDEKDWGIYPSDAVGRLELANDCLSELKEDFYQINKKLNSLI